MAKHNRAVTLERRVEMPTDIWDQYIMQLTTKGEAFNGAAFEKAAIFGPAEANEPAGWRVKGSSDAALFGKAGGEPSADGNTIIRVAIDKAAMTDALASGIALAGSQWMIRETPGVENELHGVEKNVEAKRGLII